MKNLLLLAKECMNELDAIGVEYGNVVSWTVNTRAKTRWGQCQWKRINGVTTYKINISVDLLNDELSDRPAKETIFHELIHTCKDCMNHGREWQSIAELVNDCYGYNIKRCSSAEEKGVATENIVEYRYQFKCSNCGAIVKKQRKSKFTENYSKYGCGKCGQWHTFVPFE